MTPARKPTGGKATWSAVRAFRLRGHHLAPRSRGPVTQVAGDVGGIQAQVLSAAELALRARSAGLPPDAVERALWRQRRLVKAWTLRGTFHLLPAEDFPMHVAALRDSALEAHYRWFARSGLSRGRADAMAAAVVDALDHEPHTRREIAEPVVRRLGPKARRWVEHSWGGVLRIACLRGELCAGPPRGQETTFVRRDAWLRSWRPWTPAEAKAALLRRYLGAYGPATPTDFAAWSGLGVREAAGAFSSLAEELLAVDLYGRTAHTLARNRGALEEGDAGDSVSLLPTFDAFLTGHRDKGALVDERNYPRVYRKAGWISAVCLVGGRVAGLWAAKRRGRDLEVTVEPFAAFSPAARSGVKEEADDIARFLGAPDVTVRWDR